MIDFAALAKLRTDIVKMVEQRDAVIAAESLDREFCMPDGNWHAEAANDYNLRYVTLRDCAVEDIPRVVHDTVINGDVFDYRKAYLEPLMGTVQFGELRKRPCPGVILEIGAGYGALALEVMHELPQVIYIICDIPEVLLFSGIYLGINTAIKAALVPNYIFHSLMALSSPVDLVINTLSMSEMNEHQVRTYAKGISKLIGTHGVFFEHNNDNTAVRLTRKPLPDGTCLDFNAEDGSPRYLINAINYISQYFNGAAVVDGTGGRGHLWWNTP